MRRFRFEFLKVSQDDRSGYVQRLTHGQVIRLFKAIDSDDRLGGHITIVTGNAVDRFPGGDGMACRVRKADTSFTFPGAVLRDLQDSSCTEQGVCSKVVERQQICGVDIKAPGNKFIVEYVYIGNQEYLVSGLETLYCLFYIAVALGNEEYIVPDRDKILI